MRRFRYAFRFAITAVLAYLIASKLGLSEKYWAPMTALSVLQISWQKSQPMALEQLLGTLIGALIGGILALYFPGDIYAFGAAALVLGIGYALIDSDLPAYRYSCTTMAMVILVPHTSQAWIVPLHRFVEVTVGIIVASAVGYLTRGADDPPAPAAP